MKNLIPLFEEFINEDADWNSDHDFGIFMVGGSIGDTKDGITKRFGSKNGTLSRTFADAAEAKAVAKRMTKSFSPGERKHYGLGYKFAKLTPEDKEAIKNLK